MDQIFWQTFFPANVEDLRAINLRIALFAILIFVFLIIYVLVENTDRSETKTILYIGLTAVTIIPTIYFVASAVYINTISTTGGPVHWHADFRIFACGQELKSPLPPTKLSNKTGTAVLHEHEDRRIHVEGVVVEQAEVNLANFFRVQGGELTTSQFTVPTASGLQTWQNGDLCPGGWPGVWNVFLYQTEGQTARQGKLVDYPAYVPSPESLVPPGDCLIFEFGEDKSRTDKLCDFYQLEVNRGNLTLQ